MYNEDFFAEPGVPSQSEIEAAKEQERLRAQQQAREIEAAAEQTATVEEQTAPASTPPIQAESVDPEATEEQPQQQTDDGMNNPISQFMENAAVEVRDWIDDKLQGNQQTKEEIRAGRDTARADSQKSSEEYIEATRGSVLQEGVRAIASGAEKQVKDIQEFGSLVGDTVKTAIGAVEEGDIYNDVNADGYTALERDMAIAEPTTAVGLFARDMISFMGISNRVKALTGAAKVNQAIGGINSKAGRWAARAGSEMIYGAIADLIVDPGDANASNLIIEKVPGAERFIGMFAIDEDDSAWEKRFKGMGDGAIMGLGVEGVGVLLRGSKIGARHLAKWAKGRKGVKPSDAPAEIQAEAARLAEEYIQANLDLGYAPPRPAPPKMAYDVIDDVFKKDYSRISELSGEELKKLDVEYKAFDFEGGLNDVIAEADPEAAMEAFGKNITRKELPNGAKIDWVQKDISDEFGAQGDVSLAQRAEAIQELTDAGGQLDNQNIEDYIANKYGTSNGPLTGQKVVRIDWEIKEGELGNSGSRLYKQFGGIARDQKPGTIIQAEAAGDGYGIKGLSDARSRKINSAQIYSNRFSPETRAEINSQARAQYDSIYGEGEWSQLDREARSIHIDDMRADSPDFDNLFRDPASTEVQSIREKLYIRAGLSEPNGEGKMYGIVAYRPDGRKTMRPLDPTKPIQEQVDIAKELPLQPDLELGNTNAVAGPTQFQRPGFARSVEENNFNGSTPDRPSSYEPYERAGARSSYPIQDVIAEQAALRGRVRFSGESPNPALTDITARQLSAAVDDEATYEFIENAYESVDVDKLRKDLVTKDAAVRKEALDTLKQFAEDNVDEVNMSALLRDIKTTGVVEEKVIRSIIGQKVVKTLIVDAANQLRDLGANFTEIRGAGQDGFRQAEMMFDRMKLLVQLQVEDASTAGLKLQSLQNPVRKFLSPTAEKKVKDIWDKLDDLKARVEEGDPVASKELETLADSFILADGDGKMADSFIEKFFNMSRKNFETTMYNSYLSGLNTQQRNILGNATQIIMRPAEMALGSIGNTKDRQAALSMYGSMFQSMKEGLQIAKASWADFKTDGLEKATADGNMYEQLKNLRATAKNPAQNAAAALASAQYQLMASPWLQTPMRALNAADQGFRAVSARQMAYFDFMKLSMEDGVKFDPKKFEVYFSTKFKDGQIVDEQLLKYAKEDTFQEDLGVNMQRMSDMIDNVPMMKYVVPFVKTPTNIIKRTAQYIPLAGRIVYKTPLGNMFFKEYSQIMRGSDETAKAIYRGREGVGVMTAMVFGTLGFNGLSTGAGPRDYEDKKRWEMEGIQPHSVKIGGVWVSNRFLGPIGILMSAYSDLGMVAERRGSYESFNDLRNQLIYTTAGSLLDQSWLKGLVGSLEYLTDAAMGQRDINVDDAVASLSRALIPYQAALRSWSNTLVPGMREYNNEFEKVLAETIPGLKSQLGAERVSLKDGKPLTNAGYSALNQITPFNLNEVRTDPVIGQLNDLGVTFPTEYMDRVSGVKLTPTQKQGVHKAIAATGWYEKMKGYLKSENFTAEYDRWKDAETPESAKTSRWMRDINNMLMEAKKEGYSNYIRGGSTEAYELEQKVTTARQAALRSSQGQYKAASEEIDKLKALGVN